MRNINFLVLIAVALASFANRAEAQCRVNFNSTSGVNVAGFPDSLAAGDFNRDGKLDLAVASKNLNSVSILMNQGGTYALTLSYDVGNTPSSVAAADYNKDGNIDLAVTNQGSNTFTLLRGNGLGQFTGGFTFSTQAQPSSLAFADFNLDSSQDIAVLHLDGRFISIFFGDGTGAFNNSLNLDLNFSGIEHRGKTSIVAADINLDGRPDIVASAIYLHPADNNYASVVSALGNGAGGFAPFSWLTSRSGYVPGDIKIADVNRDGKPDVVATLNRLNFNQVYYNVDIGTGNGVFTHLEQFPPFAFNGTARSLALSDFNSDGKLDFGVSQEVAAADNFQVFSGNGDGSFPTQLPFSTGGNTQRLITADFNGDGKPDIASTDSIQNKVHITLNTCGGLKPYPKADFDGDGKTDIAIFRPSVGEWWYAKSSTGGNAAFQFGSGTDRITPGDFTGDGKIDLAFFRPSTGFWFILRSEDSSFYSFPFGANGDVPATGDYDGDGRTDAAVFRPSTSTWYINRSGGGTTIVQFGQSGDFPVAAD